MACITGQRGLRNQVRGPCDNLKKKNYFESFKVPGESNSGAAVPSRGLSFVQSGRDAPSCSRDSACRVHLGPRGRVPACSTPSGLSWRLCSLCAMFLTFPARGHYEPKPPRAFFRELRADLVVVSLGDTPGSGNGSRSCFSFTRKRPVFPEAAVPSSLPPSKVQEFQFSPLPASVW